LAIASCTAAAALAVVKPRQGDTVLIGGAAGGVGAFTVQLARLAGARVIGTGSTTSSDYLRSLRAAHAIDEVAQLVAAGQVRVPIAESFPVEQIRAAVELQARRHVHGKIVIDL
jgi:NADPH:quinone reductase-like Zn-dependent oxidoreductase